MSMVYQTDIRELKLFKRGKVRDVYGLEDKLLIVATDRISCFDFVLPTPIPEKGKVLTKISLFWFSYLRDIAENHIVSSDINDLPPSLEKYREVLDGRFMIVKKCQVVPFECVVRGYISGSAWKEYKKSSTICGIQLPPNLKESQKLQDPVFTPATKAEAGHDENVDMDYMEKKIGTDTAVKIKEMSLSLYRKARQYAEQKGIIIADTKFEFGFDNEKLVLIDEVLTPDSSRFWPRSLYKPGGPQASFDKQFVRDYLEKIKWPKSPPAPELPADIVNKTLEKYREALKSLTGAI
ncbi:MAG: phosphoribosylaminoimidazolesuccinocarboxamide synthase [Candidatus Omnitrophota bacterium]|nr:MAG: phosphoribosylaminoimidazolesuccinocarboxamide synthase [Candidatus Omnitrophota bacterium]